LRRKATLVSVGLVVLALGFAGVLSLCAGPAERLLFGGKYAADAWLMPVLALVPVGTGFSTGYSMALRASQRPQFDLIANAVSAPLAVVSAIFFMRWWGIPGVAVSMAITTFAVSAVVAVAYRRVLT
jgi:O-antigen/teichoic acid export membrane protein